MSTELVKTSARDIAKVVEGTLTADDFRVKLKAFFGNIEELNEEIQNVVALVANNPGLQKCSPKSIAMAAFNAAANKISVNPTLGLAYLIPTWNKEADNGRGGKGAYEARFQRSYKGDLLKVMETGFVLDVIAHCVYENEPFDHVLGSHPRIEHKPILDSTLRGPLKAVYAIAYLKNGRWHPKVLTLGDVEHHRKCSQQADGSTWKQHYDAMALKTVIKVLCGKLPFGSKELIKLAEALKGEDTEVAISRDTPTDFQLPPAMRALMSQPQAQLPAPPPEPMPEPEPPQPEPPDQPATSEPVEDVVPADEPAIGVEACKDSGKRVASLKSQITDYYQKCRDEGFKPGSTPKMTDWSEFNCEQHLRIMSEKYKWTQASEERTQGGR